MEIYNFQGHVLFEIYPYEAESYIFYIPDPDPGSFPVVPDVNDPVLPDHMVCFCLLLPCSSSSNVKLKYFFSSNPIMHLSTSHYLRMLLGFHLIERNFGGL